MGSLTPQIAKQAQFKEVLKDWEFHGKPEYRTNWLGVPVSALKDADEGKYVDIETLRINEADAFKPSTTSALIAERHNTHGDWHEQSRLAQELKIAVTSRAVGKLKPHQLEAVEMILVKISRIVTGNPNEPDHWMDIQGYALLGKQGHDGVKAGNS